MTLFVNSPDIQNNIILNLYKLFHSIENIGNTQQSEEHLIFLYQFVKDIS